jgi:hypothetical protein
MPCCRRRMEWVNRISINVGEKAAGRCWGDRASGFTVCGRDDRMGEYCGWGEDGAGPGDRNFESSKNQGYLPSRSEFGIGYLATLLDILVLGTLLVLLLTCLRNFKVS